MGSRYYDPSAGRFITRDSIGYTGGINLYSYAGNNPVNRIDPSGHGGAEDADPDDEFDSSGEPRDPVENWFWRYNNARLITGESAGLTQAEIDEQAWTDNSFEIRDNERWKLVHNQLTPSEKEALRVKLKITEVTLSDKAHTNKTPGHWFRILRQVSAMRSSGDYDKIFANLSVNRALGIRISPNRLPDVLGIRWDGKVDLFEVPSKTDNIKRLEARMLVRQGVSSPALTAGPPTPNNGGDSWRPLTPIMGEITGGP